MVNTVRHEHGEVLTRRWVVDLVLDLAGYTVENDLATMVAVEPSFGRGAFLNPMVERLIASVEQHGRSLDECSKAIIAIDLQEQNVRDVDALLFHRLCWSGVERRLAARLTKSWLRQGDYLLTEPPRGGVDFVIGNPPYIRLEEISDDLMVQYRKQCRTMSGRADIYVGFFERGLTSLKPGGTISFICADRWMRNQYGRDLRSLISAQFSMDVALSMHDVDAFEEKVSAYPAITVMRRSTQGQAIVADATAAFSSADAPAFTEWTRKPTKPFAKGGIQASQLPHWFDGDESWPSGEADVLALLEDLNDRLPTLEDEATGTKVGIGIATGNDGVYLTTDPQLVESARLLPLVVRSDTATGQIQWHGTFLVNPWDKSGSLVNLDDFPKLREHFEAHRPQLVDRHVGKKDLERWYRTIDKVDARLTSRPKLLFPDMARSAHPTLDSGDLYPHHNLYWVISDKWDLRVLGGLLLSKVTDAFVGSYCVRMRGGTMRFQAQYLRRIRVPPVDSLSAQDMHDLADAFDRRDVKAATDAAIRVYGIEQHRTALEAIR